MISFSVTLCVNWKIKIFGSYQIYDAYRWALRSKYHIAAHVNTAAVHYAYHVIGKDPETLKAFGREMGCPEYMFKVMNTHGKKNWKGKTIYHFDDWREGVKGRYEEFVNWQEYQDEQNT